MSKKNDRSIDPTSQQMLGIAEEKGYSTAWDRWEAMQPQCGFGSLGICCRICNMGPCRIDPFGQGPQTGVCGADADTIAARNLVRMIAAGVAAHSDHGRDVAHTVLMTAKGEAAGYEIKDEAKLKALSQEYGIDTSLKDKSKLAEEGAEKAFSEFGQQHGALDFLKRAPEKQRRNWREQNVVPRGVDREVVELMPATPMGGGNHYKDVLRIGTKAALADGWGG